MMQLIAARRFGPVRALLLVGVAGVFGAVPVWAQNGAQPKPGAETAAAPQGGATSAGPTFPEMLAALSPEEKIYFQHNATLSNPFFEGRAPGLRGNELAGEYCEFYFKKLGLEPIFTQPPSEGAEAKADKADDKEGAKGGDKGGAKTSYRQRFRAGSQINLANPSMMVTLPGGTAAAAMELGREFTVTPQSGDGKAEGELVFVGYSIEHGPDDYSTYLQKDGKDTDAADLSGKIAMVLRLEPKNEKGKSRWAAEGSGAAWSENARLSGKLRRAVQRGATAIILVNPPGADDPRVDKLEDVRVSPRGAGARSQDVPVVQVTIAQAEKLVSAAGKSFQTLVKDSDEHGFIVPLPGPKVQVSVETKQETTWSNNIAAVLPGRGGLADQYIVIGGHYDHVGYGAFGSRDTAGQGKLHPGADDNASGTSGVLLAAEILSKQYKALPEGASARSILFVAFSGEEGGLIGSKHFVRNSPVPLSSTYIMLNMDMIGRLREDPGLEVSGLGSAEGLEDLIRGALDKFPVKTHTLPGGSGPSDHASFYGGNVPVLAFFTGFHAEYHMPIDYYWTINTPGAVKVVNMVVELAAKFAMRAEPLPFTKTRGPSSARDLGGDNGGNGGGGPTRAAFKVQFGVRPGTYDDDKPGIPVGDVTEGTSAAEAGIKKGDRLLRWNGNELPDVQEWMKYLLAAKPGDLVQVTVQRGSEELTVPVTLKARDNAAER